MIPSRSRVLLELADSRRRRLRESARAWGLLALPFFPVDGPLGALDVDEDEPHELVEGRRVAARLLAREERERAERLTAGRPSPLDRLQDRLGLGRFEVDVVLLALLAEQDPGAARQLAEIDPLGLGRVTVAAVLEVLVEARDGRVEALLRLDEEATLVAFGVVHLLPPASGGHAGRLSQVVELDRQVFAFLAGAPRSDRGLRPHARWMEAGCDLDAVLVPAAMKAGLAELVSRGGASGRAVYLHGAPGVGKRTLVSALARRVGAPLLAVDCVGLFGAGEETCATVVRAIRREARLHGALVHWIGGDAVLAEGPAFARAALVAALTQSERPSFLSGTRGDLPGALVGVQVAQLEVPRPTPAIQARLWERALGGVRVADVDVATLTGTLRLTGGQIRETVEVAQSLARGRGGDEALRLADLVTTQRLHHGRRLAELGRRIETRARWDDLILSTERKSALRELCVQFRHRHRVFSEWGFHRKGHGRPLAALLAGAPGTGKTMAAGVVCAELGIELYQIDLSRVVSKYIGETEKHLSELFDEAEAAGAALLFDEAETLFARRTEVRDSHDRYANLETGHLLQRIEAFDGLVILATNLLKNIDDAFIRRFAFIIEFPLPGAAERLQIWRTIWPPEAPLARDIDLGVLAQKIELTGGYIRNIALSAAFLAAEEGGAIAMRHVLAAARREYQKVGKTLDVGRAPGRL